MPFLVVYGTPFRSPGHSGSEGILLPQSRRKAKLDDVLQCSKQIITDLTAPSLTVFCLSPSTNPIKDIIVDICMCVGLERNVDLKV